MANLKNNDDTIAAVATSVGESGIGIVRLSGKDALRIADGIFISKNDRGPLTFKTYTTHYGWIVERRASCVVRRAQKLDDAQRTAHSAQQDIIDEVILTVMRAPKSYTREDIVEINCHGGIVALRRVLDLVLGKGARLAEPGEFTKRAFLNGRIDLAQAEAVLDIIRAKTDSALKVGAEQLRGVLSAEINKLRDILLDTLALIEANIDFPEEEIKPAGLAELGGQLIAVEEKLGSMLQGALCGKLLREGLHVVICGKPNVGKSSTLNALLKQERSIVTAVAGTTRDTIEEIIDIRGIPARVVDTAGIIQPRGLVEKKAVQRSRRQIDLADLVLLVFDGSKKLDRQDEILVKKLKNKNTIAVVNKMDLAPRIERDKIRKNFTHLVDISAKKMRNIGCLEEEIAGLVYRGKLSLSEPLLVTNRRHIECLGKAQKSVEDSRKSLDNKLSLEFAAQDIKEGLGSLDEILGKSFGEDLLDRIFADFCIGK
jgi:tRNA modification GTPase